MRLEKEGSSSERLAYQNALRDFDLIIDQGHVIGLEPDQIRTIKKLRAFFVEFTDADQGIRLEDTETRMIELFNHEHQETSGVSAFYTKNSLPVFLYNLTKSVTCIRNLKADINTTQSATELGLNNKLIVRDILNMLNNGLMAIKKEEYQKVIQELALDTSLENRTFSLIMIFLKAARSSIERYWSYEKKEALKAAAHELFTQGIPTSDAEGNATHKKLPTFDKLAPEDQIIVDGIVLDCALNAIEIAGIERQLANPQKKKAQLTTNVLRKTTDDLRRAGLHVSEQPEATQAVLIERINHHIRQEAKATTGPKHPEQKAVRRFA